MNNDLVMHSAIQLTCLGTSRLFEVTRTRR